MGSIPDFPFNRIQHCEIEIIILKGLFDCGVMLYDEIRATYIACLLIDSLCKQEALDEYTMRRLIDLRLRIFNLFKSKIDAMNFENIHEIIKNLIIMSTQINESLLDFSDQFGYYHVQFDSFCENRISLTKYVAPRSRDL